MVFVVDLIERLCLFLGGWWGDIFGICVVVFWRDFEMLMIEVGMGVGIYYSDRKYNLEVGCY